VSRPSSFATSSSAGREPVEVLGEPVLQHGAFAQATHDEPERHVVVAGVAGLAVENRLDLGFLSWLAARSSSSWRASRRSSGSS